MTDTSTQSSSAPSPPAASFPAPSSTTEPTSSSSPARSPGAAKPANQSPTVKPSLNVQPSSWFGACRLPKAVQSKPYPPQTISVSNGRPPYKFSPDAQASFANVFDPQSHRPPGLEIDESTGILSGTPTSGGTYNFAVKVTDADGKEGIGQFVLAVELNLDRYSAYFDGTDFDSPDTATCEVCRFNPDAKGPGDEPSFPLSLCEFLAYKSAQAYLGNDPKKPNEYLKKELDDALPKGVNSHFAFFDSTTPLVKMDDKAAEAAANERLDRHLSLIYGPKAMRRKSPRLIVSPHKELSFMKKYYGPSRTTYIF